MKETREKLEAEIRVLREYMELAARGTYWRDRIQERINWLEGRLEEFRET